MFNNFYKNKKVLITGHTGFKGSWIAKWLDLLGAKVIGYSLYEHKKPNHFNSINIKKKIISIKGDIKNYDLLKKTIYRYKPEIIFHLAAQPIVSESFSNPKNTFDTNLSGMTNLMNILKDSSTVKSAVLITSDKAYKNDGRSFEYNENDILFGSDPYSASKSCAEIIASSYFRSFFTKSHCKIGIARAGNVIGGGDWAENRIVPDLMRHWIKKKKAIIRNPRSTRPWQHVLEPLSGYLLIGKLLYEKNIINGEAFNFGPKKNNDILVKYLVKKFQKEWINSKIQIKKTKNKYKEEKLLNLCIKKSYKLLRWQPVLNINELVEFTVNWYQSWAKKVDCNKITENQILDYYNLAIKRKNFWIK